MKRNWLILFVVSIAVITAVFAGGLLYRWRYRFTHVSSDPYVMFDTRTAQSCWSGPEDHMVDAFNAMAAQEAAGQEYDPTKTPPHPLPHLSANGLVYCKDLLK